MNFSPLAGCFRKGWLFRKAAEHVTAKIAGPYSWIHQFSKLMKRSCGGSASFNQQVP
jgi:hypothetical protein